MTRSFDAERQLRQHGAALRSLALALLGDPHAADDAVQETWLRAIEQPPAHVSSPGGWLATVLRRLVSRSRRDEHRRRRHDTAAMRKLHSPGADVQAAREEMLRAVVDAVLALEAPYRDVIWQRFLEERTPAAIARSCGEPVTTVKSRLQRGLAQLRQRLDERGKGREWRTGLMVAFDLALAAPELITTGALVMGTTAKVSGAAGLVVAVLLCWLLMQPDAAAPPLSARTTSEAATTVASAPDQSSTSRMVASVPQAADLRGESQPRERARTRTSDEFLDIIEVGDTLRLPVDLMLERLPLTDSVRAACASKELRRSVELRIEAARQRLDEQFAIHSTIALQAAETLFAEGRGRRTKPENDQASAYSNVMGSGGHVWLSNHDVPELFMIKDAMRRLARDLADELTQLALTPTDSIHGVR